MAESSNCLNPQHMDSQQFPGLYLTKGIGMGPRVWVQGSGSIGTRFTLEVAGLYTEPPVLAQGDIVISRPTWPHPGVTATPWNKILDVQGAMQWEDTGCYRYSTGPWTHIFCNSGILIPGY